MRVLLSILLCISSCVAFAEGEAPTAADIEAWIKQLSSEDFDAREAAAKKLADNLQRAEPQLSAAYEKTTDLELRNQLSKLIPVGSVVWTFEAGYLFGTPVVSGNRLFVANKDETFFCLDADSGKKIWATPIRGLMFHAPATDGKSVVTIRTRKDGRKDGTVFCLDCETGAERWSFRGRDSQTFTAPAIANGKVYFACEELMLCLNLADGTKVWEFAADDLLMNTPALCDGKLFVGGLDHKLHCLDAATGAKKWAFETGGTLQAGAIAVGDRVYVGSQDSHFYAVDIATGKEVWKFDAGASINGSPAYSNGQLFFGTSEGSFFALNAADGNELWNVKTNGVIYGSAAVVSERVYFGSINNKLTLFALNTADGKQAWTFETKEAGYVWPVLAGRRLFVGYHSLFYALRTNRNGPIDWPMMSANPSRTGSN